jgi:hypothetical protein
VQHVFSNESAEQDKGKDEAAWAEQTVGLEAGRARKPLEGEVVEVAMAAEEEEVEVGAEE